MSLLFDRVLVLDLEATCWKGPPPPGMDNEVLEVGLAVANLRLMTIEKTESLVVKPKVSEISAFCTKLTGITAEEAAKGKSFRAVCTRLQERYKGRRHTWASWGHWDRDKLVQQCRDRGLEYPLSQNHLNLKNLFALMMGLDHEPGLDKALKLANLEPEGRAHRGVDDALNAARLLLHLMQAKPPPSAS